MLALRKTAATYGADLVEVDPPHEPEEGEVIVAVAATGICGSDLHAYEWTAGYGFMREAMPVTLGHEFAGKIITVGVGVDDRSVGDRVVCWPTIACGRCTDCRADRPQDCMDRRIVGLHRDGAMTALVRIPAANCFPVPEGLPLDLAALAEPLAVAVHAVDVAAIGPGVRVVMLGPGPIGLLSAWVAQRRGGRVLLAGLDDAFRLETAAKIGITRVADLATATLREAAASAFGDDGEVDRIIEATGAAQSVADGLGILRSSGIMVVAGIHAEAAPLDLTRFVRMKHQLRAAHDTTAGAFAEALDLLAGHGDALSALITARFPLAQATEAFELARSRRAAKVMVAPMQNWGLL
jgi:L-iditol 2-dehydrogenase